MTDPIAYENGEQLDVYDVLALIDAEAKRAMDEVLDVDAILREARRTLTEGEAMTDHDVATLLDACIDNGDFDRLLDEVDPDPDRYADGRDVGGGWYDDWTPGADDPAAGESA